MAWTALNDLIPTEIGAVTLICSRVGDVYSLKCHIAVKDQNSAAIWYVRDNLENAVTPGRIAQAKGILDDLRQKAEAELL